MLFRILAPLTLLATGTAAMAQDVPDRPVQRTEVVAAIRHQFTLIDANHDGIITRAEFDRFRASPAGRAAEANQNAFEHIGGHWYDHADPNGTGRVTLAMASARPLQQFDTADLNHDHVLSVEELKLVLAMKALAGHF